MTLQLNSLLNLIANSLLFLGGFLFYYNILAKDNIKNNYIYYLMRLLTAMLVTGAFARVVYDLDLFYQGSHKAVSYIANIALVRNFGLGGILIYLTLKV